MQLDEKRSFVHRSYNDSFLRDRKTKLDVTSATSDISAQTGIVQRSLFDYATNYPFCKVALCHHFILNTQL